MNSRELDKRIEESKCLIVEFGTGSCSACRGIRDKIEKKIDENSPFEFVYISIDQYPEVAGERGIFSGPTIEVYINGKMTLRKSGYFSLEEVFSDIKRYFEVMGE